MFSSCRIVASALTTALVCVASQKPALAQNITFDGTLGPAGTLTGPTYTIRQADGITVNDNLFHSFGQFNLGVTEGANFESAGNIRNIVSRVTGGLPSTIDGLIYTESSTVNFFLINPSGIVFGPNARLDIGGEDRGSFVATTLDALTFPNGAQFSATNPGNADSLLNIVGDPSGFLASQRSIPAIAVTGSNLRVPDTQSLLLLGGNVTIDNGRLDAWGGRVEIGAVAGTGTIDLYTDGSLNIPTGVQRGDVTFTNGSLVDVTLDDGGDLSVTANNIRVLEGSVLKAGIDQGLGTETSQAGTMLLDAMGLVQVVGQSSRLENDINENAFGSGGAIVITANALEVRDNARLSTSTLSIGDAGYIFIDVRDRVLFDNGEVRSTVGADAEGEGGYVQIVANSLDILNGSEISVSTLGFGDAGEILIEVGDRVLLNNSVIKSNVEEGAEGEGGYVQMTANSLEVLNGSEVNASTDGMGDAGYVLIEASDRVLFNNGFILSNVGTDAEGDGGYIGITANSLEVLNESQLIASTDGMGDAGYVSVEVGDRVLLNNGFIRNEVEANATGKGSYLEITANSLEVLNGSQLIASTDGIGNAGDILIEARDSVNIAGTSLTTGRSSALFTSTTSDQSGGNILVNTRNFRLADGSVVDARTEFTGNSGFIDLTAATVDLLNGGQLLAITEDSGRAGNIIVRASERLTIAGTDSTYATRLAQFETAVAPISAASGIFVRSQGTGGAGDISIATQQLRMNRGVISAESAAVDGGNINLDIGQLLLMRNGSLISATAGSAQSGGNGGNINIQARNAFIVGVLRENSDITANAFTGNGGRINITTNAIYGLKFQSKLTPLSDITASSQFGLSGTVAINTLNVDPNRGLVTLPVNLVDPASRIQATCATTSQAKNRNQFVVTGRGGIPESPGDAFKGDRALTNLTDLVETQSERTNASASTVAKSAQTIVEAQGWKTDANGLVYLISEASESVPHANWQSSADCLEAAK